MPCQFGQSMEVLPHQSGTLHWRSYDVNKAIWLEVIINTASWSILHSSDQKAAERLVQVLKAAEEFQASIDLQSGFNIWTRLDFDRSWGLGSSSTMLSLVAQWTGVDPFKLAEKTFGGSGYDIACATASGPISYQRTDNDPLVEALDFNPSFKDQLYFVHLGEKKDTQDALSYYADLAIDNKQDIQSSISDINEQILNAGSLSTFRTAIDAHEDLISTALSMTKVKEERFPDFDGSIKSLGAWGGDFVLVASEQSSDQIQSYFNQKGYSTVLSWKHMIL